MRQAERDALLLRQTEAAEAHAQASRALAEGVLAGIRRESERERAGVSVQPFRLLAGERGVVTLIRTLPGYAGLWEREVPERYVIEAKDRRGAPWLVVSCPCGSQTVLSEGHTACVGGCGRWFLPTGRGVRVYRPAEAA